MGTLIPWIRPQVFTNSGDPAASHKLFTYAAGTSTKQPTYSDAALNSANTNPIVLPSSGIFTAFAAPGQSFKFVLTTSGDTDPPAAPIYTIDNVTTVPLSATNVDVTGTVGESVNASAVVYLSDGSGSLTAGKWYLADADQTYSSNLAKMVGFAVSALGIQAGETSTGAIRTEGRVTGLAALSAGTVYYISTTGGGLTSTPPTNARAVAVADSSTSVVILPYGMEASSTAPGIISTAAQTIPGNKTFAGFVKSSHVTAGIGYATGAGGTVTQATNKSTGVTLDKATGQITMNNANLNADTTVSFVLTSAAIAAADVLVLNHISGGTPGSYLLNARSAAGSATIDVRNITTGALAEAIVISYAVVKAVTS